MKCLKFFIVFVLLSSCSSSFSQPARRALMGMTGKSSPSGIVVDSIAPNSTFAAFPIVKGDVLLAVNGKGISTIETYNATVTVIRSGDPVKITYQHGKEERTASANAVMRPLEVSPIADFTYDWIKFRNGYLRVITRKPKDRDKVPAILLIPGYNCGSVENYSNSYNGKLINEWLKNGFAVVTVEKSGVGDSYGCEPCQEVDLATDIESFDKGYQYMEQLTFVDKEQLFIWGHSMGGTIAPEVAKKHSPKGVMVFACVFRPWSEFLLEMHRIQKPLLEGLNYQETETFVRGIQKIYYEFFVLKKSPAELFGNPEYQELLTSEFGYKEGSNDLWGRHWRFWQQLDSINLAESWKQVNCPVLVLHGGADYEQCSFVEPLLIKETVNSAHPDYATQVTIPDLDHFMMKSRDWKDATENFRKQDYLKGNFNYRLAEETVNWLKSVYLN